ncbi:hypothetical protein EAF04_010655 [Stromatinia cepivora]|nr:hypothetical protein EAF04_010655 [Stromatinia cepivora]
MLRGVLVSAIYRKTTANGISLLDNSAAVTLMSTDIERITTGFVVVHELWAGLIQVGITTWLLKTQLGVACVAPILVSLFCTLLSSVAGTIAEKRQQSWMVALQKRVGITAEMLSFMRGIKLAGLTEKLRNIIQTLRINEIDSAGKYRQCLVWFIALAYSPQLLSPFLALIIFSAQSGSPLSTTVAFTATSLITLLTNPLAQLFLNFLPFAAAIGCFDRVAIFLCSQSRIDRRLFTIHDDDSYVHANQHSEKSDNHCHGRNMKKKSLDIVHHGPESAAVSIQGGVFGWIPNNPILRDIDCTIVQSKVTAIVGTIACGKSTFLKAILGEVPLAEGSLTLSLKTNSNSAGIAFCGSSTEDNLWYKKVVQACCLEGDFQSLLQRDQSIVGSKGFSLSGGQKQRLSIARAVYSRAQLILFDDVFSSEDAKTVQLVSEQLWGPRGLLRSTGTTVILASNNTCMLPFVDEIIIIGKDGTIEKRNSASSTDLLEVYSRQECSPIGNGQENTIVTDKSTKVIIGETLLVKENLSDSGFTREHTSDRQTGELAVYRFYFATIGFWPLVLFFLSMSTFAFFYVFPTIWLKLWTSYNMIHGNQKIDLYLGLYGAYQIMALLAVTLSAWELAYMVMVKSGASLHLITLSTVINAPFAFFSETDTGQITNRFSQDLELIDGELPTSLLGAGVNALICIMQAISIATGSAYIAISFPFLICMLYFLQKFYLRTSRQIRHLDLELKSPLYSHFLETISGLAHIRAFNWTEESCATNHKLLDISQRPFYLLFMIQRWLNLVLDLFCGGIAFLVVTLAVTLRDHGSASPGLGFGNLETSIGAVSRIKSFSESTIAEDKFDEANSPLVGWPTTGKLDFVGVSASYNSQDGNVLKNISFSIQPGEKIGICGRSGSGKSSLILALFRMLDLNSGAIFVDSQDISKIPRTEIRSKLNALPQEPFFFSGSSVRMNLDPFETSDDVSILDALEKVELRARILNQLGGLDGEMNPELLSHGQKQLFSLVRVMLRDSNIVVLDEATSSVDHETDEKIQRVIRDAFAGKTIIAVAHRLDTILDFDKIAVMDQGMLVEFDKPEVLLERESVFKKLYRAYNSGGELE